jgi:hypothetical protein
MSLPHCEKIVSSRTLEAIDRRLTLQDRSLHVLWNARREISIASTFSAKDYHKHLENILNSLGMLKPDYVKVLRTYSDAFGEFAKTKT